jgi:hypothetical protein
MSNIFQQTKTTKKNNFMNESINRVNVIKQHLFPINNNKSSNIVIQRSFVSSKKERNSNIIEELTTSIQTEHLNNEQLEYNNINIENSNESVVKNTPIVKQDKDSLQISAYYSAKEVIQSLLSSSL